MVLAGQQQMQGGVLPIMAAGGFQIGHDGGVAAEFALKFNLEFIAFDALRLRLQVFVQPLQGFARFALAGVDLGEVVGKTSGADGVFLLRLLEGSDGLIGAAGSRQRRPSRS